MSLKLLLLILFLINSVGFAENVSVPLLKARWKLQKGSSFCQLRQNIPKYGMADFMHYSGDLLRFSIREYRYKPEIGKASLSITTLPWDHQSFASQDYSVYLDDAIDIQAYPRLSVYGETAEIMLDALSNGMSPTFTYRRPSFNGLWSETNVAVSAVNFAKKYAVFRRCRKSLLPFGLKDTLEKSLFFRPASNQLNSVVLTQLKNTAHYVKKVKSSRIVIISDTAIAGKRDKSWFLKRANLITNKLNMMGVSKKKISIQSGVQVGLIDRKVIQLSVFGPDALKAIYYRKGNTKLTRTEKRRLDLMVRYAEEFLSTTQLVINSHTDSKGKKAKNLKVSQERGNVIKRYLVSKGMDEKMVKVRAYGERRPIKSNRFPRGRAQNRRAVIDFVG